MVARTYLDHASTSPLRPEARAALVAVLDLPGDPGRVHAEGMAARAALEEARGQVAGLLGARPREVVFTSGATEAVAAACWGAAARGTARRTGERAAAPDGRGHQVVAAVEHSAVRRAAARHGEVTVVPVDRRGAVDLEALLAAVRPDTDLVHLQWGNHEVGTLQPVEETAAACRERGVLLHVDAAQAVGRVPIDFRALGADLLSVSAHKLGGPRGAGALLVRQGLRLPPLLVGGDQERARRAGLEDLPAAAGFGAACAALAAPAADGRPTLEHEAAEQRRLTARILDAVGGDGLGDLTVYGDPDHRLPHIACLGVAGIEPQAVLLGLDRAGIAAHSGSACASESLEPSPVLEAMGVDAHHSLRLSVGWSTTDADVDRLLDALPAVLAELRALAAAARRG
ncbi:MAG TPA: cysteine desulfurase family protein [Acidimicrobiales bacterium]|nr:cysteine desulfurase family protein [Acidimicrobiales bacterium]